MTYTYAIVNRRGGDRKWYAYNTDDVVWKGSKFGEWANLFGGSESGRAFEAASRTIKNNEIQHPDLLHDTMLLCIEGASFVGPWTVKHSDHLVITPNGGGSTPDGLRPVLVSVEAAAQYLNNALKGHTTEAPKGAQEDTADKVIQVVLVIASSVMNGVSTAFSAMGGGRYAASAGITGLAAGLMSVFGGDRGSGGPPPLSSEQIESAMKKVTDSTAAADAATHFVETYDWFRAQGKLIAASKGEPLEHLVDDYDKHLELALDSTNHSSFAYTLNRVRDNPSICYYILPHYMIAAGLYLTLSRIHFAMYNVPESMKKPPRGAVPPEAIEPILEDTQQLRKGLEKARDYFISVRNTYIQSSGLKGTPEAIVPIKIFTKHYLGAEYGVPHRDYVTPFPKGSDFLANVDLSLKDSTGATYTLPKVGQGYNLKEAAKYDPVQTSLTKLRDIEWSLKRDLIAVEAGGWPTNLLNINWDA